MTFPPVSKEPNKHLAVVVASITEQNNVIQKSAFIAVCLQYTLKNSKTAKSFQQECLAFKKIP